MLRANKARRAIVVAGSSEQIHATAVAIHATAVAHASFDFISVLEK